MIVGDDTNPGRGLMEMIPPEACMDKHEGRRLVDCADCLGPFSTGIMVRLKSIIQGVVKPSL